MNKDLLSELKNTVQGLVIKENVPWKEFSFLGIGTDKNIIVIPENDMKLRDVLQFCFKNKIETRIIGAGCNTLGSDEVFDGLIIRLIEPAFTGITVSHSHVTAGAGINLKDFITYCAQKGLGGYSCLAGIPGTLGGSVRMNAGAHGMEIKDILEDVCGFYPDGTPWCADVSELYWDYRAVNIPEDIIITAVICKLKQVNPEEELKKIKKELQWRITNFPQGRSVGCVFKNPTEGISAGKMIDDSGCKGTRIGGAVISSKHGNYFINDANATEKDYADLMIFTMKKVFELYGIILTPEIKFINQETEKRVTTAIAPLKVLILKGGNSNERDISLQSAKEVEDALKSLGHKVRSIDIKSLEEWREINLEKGEVVFPVLHGGFGENGEIQKLFEADGVPFVGSGSSSCFLAMDKVESKKIMQQNNLPTPPFAYFDNSNAPFPENIELPIVVKPAVEGSTVGITLLKNKSKWSEALKLALQYSDRVIAEAYISGTEITVGVLDGKPLPVVEIKYPGELFDYDAKYEHKQGETEYICPTESLSLPIINRAQEVAVAFAESIDIRHLTRVDLIIAEDGTPYILEANNMPGFTSESLLPKAANAAGIPFPVLCSKLAVLANKK